MRSRRHWHYEDHELELLAKILEALGDIDEALADLSVVVVAIQECVCRAPRQSTTAVLGGEMSIPSGGSTPITLTFVDGTTTPPTPINPPAGDGSGLVVTITADNPIVTIGAVTASGDTALATASAGDVTVDTPFNYNATVANASGAALSDDDGTTPFVQPAPLASSVLAPVTPPSQATTAVLSEG